MYITDVSQKRPPEWICNILKTNLVFVKKTNSYVEKEA